MRALTPGMPHTSTPDGDQRTGSANEMNPSPLYSKYTTVNSKYDIILLTETVRPRFAVTHIGMESAQLEGTRLAGARIYGKWRHSRGLSHNDN